MRGANNIQLGQRITKLADPADASSAGDITYTIGGRDSFGNLFLHSEFGFTEQVHEFLIDNDPRYRIEGDFDDKPEQGIAPAWYHTLPRRVRGEAEELELHIREYVTGEPLPGLPRQPQYDPDRPLAERRAAKAKELERFPKSLRMSASSLRRHEVAYGRNPHPAALVKKSDVRQYKSLARYDPRLIEAIRETEKSFRDETSPVPREYHERLAANLAAKGVAADELPHRSTLWRLIPKVVNAEQLFGPSETRRKQEEHDDVWLPAEVSEVGERIEIDTTPLDLRTVWLSPGGKIKVTDKCELTVAIDCATRCILAWQVTPPGASGADLAELLAQMCTPEPMRPGWSDRMRWAHSMLPFERLATLDERFKLASYRPVIVPRTIIVDQGSIYVSEAAQAFCLRHGINLVLARKKTGKDKPFVEAFFRGVRKRFTSAAKGYKGQSVAYRGADVDSDAAWTLPEIEELFAEFIMVVYLNTPHKSLPNPASQRNWAYNHPGHRDTDSDEDADRPPQEGQFLTPLQAHNYLIHQTGMIPRPFGRKDFVRLHPCKHKRVTRRGILLFGLQYAAPDVLAPYKDQRSTNPDDGKWEVFYSRNDVSHVWLWDDALDDYVTVPWVGVSHLDGPVSHILTQEARRQLTEDGVKGYKQEEISAYLKDLQARLRAGPEGRKRETKIEQGNARAAKGRAAQERHGVTADTTSTQTGPPSEAADTEPVAPAIPIKRPRKLTL